MSAPRYYLEPYERTFNAHVLKHENDWFLLDSTLFYPGGGGQDPDTGTLGGHSVVELDSRPDGVWHKVPGLTKPVGEAVSGEIDWANRYDLMRGHTGEHLLFSTLLKLNPGLTNVKVAIKRGHCSIFMNGPLTLEDVEKALVIVNGEIGRGRPVKREVVPIEQAKASGLVRGKWDNIKSAEISCITIEGLDSSACAGVHISNISELGALAVKRLVKGKGSDLELEFAFAEEAARLMAKDNRLALELTAMLNAPPETVVQAVANLSSECDRLKDAQDVYVKSYLDQLKPERVGAYDLYWHVFQGVNQKEVNRWAATKVLQKGTFVLAFNRGKNVSVLFSASHDAQVDCNAMLKELLVQFDGRGGGTPKCAQGGVGDYAPLDKMVQWFKDKLSVVPLPGQ